MILSIWFLRRLFEETEEGIYEEEKV